MKIEIWTDGSSRGNPGKGGWGSIIITKDEVIELGGSDKMTTNNKMELLASIEGLKEIEGNIIKETKEVTVCTDSQYVKKGMTEWIDGWIAKDWKGSTKKPVMNQDLWKALKKEEDRLKNSGIKIIWKYVKAHCGIALNERADEIATMLADGHNVELYRGDRSGYNIVF